jgi:hypothetical protein
LKRLDVTSQFIIQSVFGIFGGSGSSAQKVAREENVSHATISGLQADALRALMGYGPKAKDRAATGQGGVQDTAQKNDPQKQSLFDIDSDSLN